MPWCLKADRSGSADRPAGQNPLCDPALRGISLCGYLVQTGWGLCLSGALDGRTDDDGFTGDLAEKIGVESLKARENRMYTYGIEFH